MVFLRYCITMIFVLLSSKLLPIADFYKQITISLIAI